jgi:hypothetical protein
MSSHSDLSVSRHVELDIALANFDTRYSPHTSPVDWLNANKKHIRECVNDFAGFTANEQDECVGLIEDLPVYMVGYLTQLTYTIPEI